MIFIFSFLGTSRVTKAGPRSRLFFLWNWMCVISSSGPKQLSIFISFLQCHKGLQYAWFEGQLNQKEVLQPFIQERFFLEFIETRQIHSSSWNYTANTLSLDLLGELVKHSNGKCLKLIFESTPAGSTAIPCVYKSNIVELTFPSGTVTI